MTISLFSSAQAEPVAVSPENLAVSIKNLCRDLQTGILEIAPDQDSRHYLLFVRGQPLNLYRQQNGAPERLDPETWLQKPGQPATLRALSLTPHAIRLVKILLEQTTHSIIPCQSFSLEEQVENWVQNPVPAVLHLRWQTAEALIMLPGQEKPVHYPLFLSSDQILHSAGGMMALYGWKEPCASLRLLSSEAGTPAWQEYLLYYSFSWLVSHLLERLRQLAGPLRLNTMLREVNFTANARQWNIEMLKTSVTDQAIFSHPAQSAEVYSRLLEILFQHAEQLIGAELLASLLRETVLRMPAPSRSVLQEYLLITPA